MCSLLQIVWTSGYLKLLEKNLNTLMPAQNVIFYKSGPEYDSYVNGITNTITSSCQWPEQYNLASKN